MTVNSRAKVKVALVMILLGTLAIAVELEKLPVDHSVARLFTIALLALMWVLLPVVAILLPSFYRGWGWGLAATAVLMGLGLATVTAIGDTTRTWFFACSLIVCLVGSYVFLRDPDVLSYRASQKQQNNSAA